MAHFKIQNSKARIVAGREDLLLTLQLEVSEVRGDTLGSACGDAAGVDCCEGGANGGSTDVHFGHGKSFRVNDRHRICEASSCEPLRTSI